MILPFNRLSTGTIRLQSHHIAPPERSPERVPERFHESAHATALSKRSGPERSTLGKNLPGSSLGRSVPHLSLGGGTAERSNAGPMARVALRGKK
jgi:hypothetical protein